MNKPRSRISVISVIKFWSSSPPSWYSRSSVLCGGKDKLFNWSFEGFWLSVNFLKVRKFVYVLEMLIVRHPGTPNSSFRWLQFASLDARSRFIHICDTASTLPSPAKTSTTFFLCSLCVFFSRLAWFSFVLLVLPERKIELVNNSAALLLYLPPEIISYTWSYLIPPKCSWLYFNNHIFILRFCHPRFIFFHFQ